ncbi:RNA-directed DNA polymerase [Cytobacillus spongiae]|uniref:RNA-directed DNA polymerase n=1 Tax=Cytobacillus spongiae TaxID=2901381 RepID=UPI001F3120A8|nr:RNA-directed DNA polymerase [Cytobacillus spongiae]UII57068.1 RNA-directed DNA polymerase [Cytobacillus spongiae]
MDWLKTLSDTHTIDPITEQVYNELINHFDSDQRCKGYKGSKQRNPRPANNENLVEIAEEIYGYFSAHYFKARHTFIEQEKVHNKDNLLKNPITIIDIGCGIGTATYALIDLIRYKNSLDNTPNSIEIKVIFVELSKKKCELLKLCIENYISKCTDIKIQYEIINDAFPNCTENIKPLINKDKNILVIMSNLVSWLKSEPYEMGKGIHKINMENPDIYDIKVINIEGHALEKKIKAQYEFLSNKGIYKIYGPDDVKDKLKYNNTKKSYWYEIAKNKITYRNKLGYLHGSVNSIPLIKAVCSSSVLELAFLKARYAHRSQGVIDEIDIKYVESNLTNIIRLIQKELEKNNGYSYSDDFLEYKIPKNEKEFRPYVIEDLKNDIVSASLIMTMGDSMDDEQDLLKREEYSFGNRLTSQLRSPYIFQAFAQKYFNEYIAKARGFSEEASQNYCIQADIKSFYTMIDKQRLKEIIENTLPSTVLWVNNTIYSYIDRIFDGCNLGKGIPQGVFMSNLLANLYLTKLDEKISQFEKSKYVRYVDDFFIFSNTKKEAEEIDKMIRGLLEKNLLLKLNEDKSGIIESEKLQWPGSREIFEDLKDKADQILRTVYKLDATNYKNYERNPQEFIESFHKCLDSVGIYIPGNWLQIKITKEASFIEKMLKTFKKPSEFFKWTKRKKIYKQEIKWDKVPLILNEKALNKWKKTFYKNNKVFVQEVEEFSDILAEKFLTNFQKVLFSNEQITDSEKKEALRIAKFCFNHLGRFKSDKIISEFENIIKNPWLLNFKPLRAYPKLGTKLLDLVTNKRTDNYLLLNSIWLLGEMKDKAAIHEITNRYIQTLDTKNKEEILLNTICAEAILKVDDWLQFPSDDIHKKVNSWLAKKIKPNYKIIRNVFLILSTVNVENFDKTLGLALNIWKDDEKITTFLNWLDEIDNPNIIDNFDYVTEEVKEAYPLTEPEPNNYQS